MQPEAASLPGVHRPPAGALRILARRNDTQILILDGEDRAIGDGERLACIEWFSTEVVAEAVAGFCSSRLKVSHFPPDADGWHSFPVDKIPILVSNAKAELNFTYHPRDETRRDRQTWTGERICLLGILIGQGWTAKRIAEHPLIRSTERNIWRQAHRFNASLSSAPQDQIVIRRLPARTRANLERAAAREQLTIDAVARRILIDGSEMEDRLALAS